MRLELVDQFEVDNVDHKLIAKRLLKAKLIDHYNPKHNIFTMARRASGDCNFLVLHGFPGNAALIFKKKYSVLRYP